MAASHSVASPSAAATAEPVGPDHDGLQQGDQTRPDTASATTVKAASTASPEPSSPEGESSTETESAVSDGPGGNADASGNVQHEFNGVQ